MERPLLDRAAMFRRALASLAVLAATACGVSPLTPDAGGPSAGGLDLNDVSFLLPLPPAGHADQLLGVAASGPRGALLPKRLWNGLPLLVEGANAEVLYGQLRVVSVRVDPCFPGSAPPAAPVCLKQVRLVAQPVVAAADGGATLDTDDAAVHLLYTLSDEDFAGVVRATWALKGLAGAATDRQPLDVHPVLQAEGLDGPYAHALAALVTDHCGEQNLVRVAFMTVASFGAAWRFGAYDVQHGVLVESAIPRIDGHTVQQVQEFGNTAFRNTALSPSVHDEPLDTLFSETAMRFADDKTLGKAITSALRIEHPDRSSPRTIDCGSCHVASRALHNAEVFRQLDESTHADAFHANPRFDLRRVDGAGDDPRAMRAFGWFGQRSALSQRTINESAAIAETLSLAGPP